MQAGNPRERGAAGRFFNGGVFCRLPIAIAAIAVPCAALLYLSEPSNPSLSAGLDSVVPPAETRLSSSNWNGQASEGLRPVANPLYTGSGVRSDDLLSRAIRHGQVSADNPFAAAYEAGNSEGTLVLERMEGKIPVLGPSTPAWAGAAPAQREILRAISSGVGGSFNKFFSTVFRHDGAAEAAESSQDMADLLEAHEENPFARMRESLSEAESTEKAPAGTEPTEETSAPAADTSSASKGTTTPQETAAPKTAAQPSVVTVRPSLLLRVDRDGVLHPMQASQPSSGRFESVEMGVQDFALLPFDDAAEFPMAIAVADFNGDGYSDVVFHVAQQGKLRFFYGHGDTTYSEELRIDVGSGPHSLAAGDFDGDGMTDLAVSPVGVGMLTVLFPASDGTYRYRTAWTDSYRDYITAADTGSGRLSVLGMNFANHGTVLLDFSREGGFESGSRFEFTPALKTEVTSPKIPNSRLNAVVLGGNLSVNLDNRMRQQVNVLNVAAGSDIYVLIGDPDTRGSMTVAVARLRN